MRYIPKVEFLRLSKNGINGTLPSGIFSLPSLSVLDVKDNQITGSLPSNIGEKKSLVFFDLHHNLMTGSIPQGYYDLSLLRISDISTNQFSGTISTQLLNLRVLSKFNVGSNLFSGSIPDFGDFEEDFIPTFDHIDLSDNLLTGTLPSWMLGLVSRQEIILNNNFLSGPISDPSSAAIAEFLADPTVLDNAKLKKVDFSNNEFTGMLPGWGGLLPSLQVRS